jgi:hemolysin III
MNPSIFSKRDEIANAITHGIGGLLSIAGLVLLIVFSSLYGTTWHIVSFTIFGSMLVLLYCISTLYHSFTNNKVKKLFRQFDHMAIFLLIAGTYTPFCVTILRGWVGWTLLGIIWCCAISGILVKSFFTGKAELMSTILYVLMGWSAVAVIKPLYLNMTPNGFLFLLLGGACYTFGVIFFLRDNIQFNHSIWHTFVLGGSVFHFFSVFTLL